MRYNANGRMKDVPATNLSSRRRFFFFFFLPLLSRYYACSTPFSSSIGNRLERTGIPSLPPPRLTEIPTPSPPPFVFRERIFERGRISIIRTNIVTYRRNESSISPRRYIRGVDMHSVFNLLVISLNKHTARRRIR